jgi:hypothetical protein
VLQPEVGVVLCFVVGRLILLLSGRAPKSNGEKTRLKTILQNYGVYSPEASPYKLDAARSRMKPHMHEAIITNRHYFLSGQSFLKEKRNK